KVTCSGFERSFSSLEIFAEVEDSSFDYLHTPYNLMDRNHDAFRDPGFQKPKLKSQHSDRPTRALRESASTDALCSLASMKWRCL
ncbi:hypothetical protein STEG23_033448, partial [Scotinomys teguina]